MISVTLTDKFYIKEIDPENEDDLWLINRLEEDPLVCGQRGYLWRISCLLDNLRYSKHQDIYNCPFSIYRHQSPIGFLNISKIYKTRTNSSVELSYALIKEERKKGYMKNILITASDYILLDKNHSIDEIDLSIHPENLASQKVAMYSGFICDNLSSKEHFEQGRIIYYKTKQMIKK